MKAFRKAITMLCVLALLLSLAPCAFAEEITAPRPPDNDGVYTATGDLHVTDSGSITVSGTSDTTVKVTGGLTNEGSVTAKAPNKGGDVSIDVSNSTDKKGTNNSGSITAEGSASAYIRNNGGLTNNETGTVTVTSSGDTTATSGMVGVVANDGDLVNDGKIEANGSHYATVIANRGDMTNSGEIAASATGKQMNNSGNVNVSATGELTNTGTGKIEATSRFDSYVKAENGTLTNHGTIELNSAEQRAYVEGVGITNTNDITAKGNMAMVNAKSGTLNNSGDIKSITHDTGFARVYGGDVINNGTIEASGGSDAGVKATGSLINNEGKTIVLDGDQAWVTADSMENYGDIILTGDKVMVAKTGDQAGWDALNAGGSYLSANEDFVNYGTITIESLEEAINGTYYGVNYVDVVDGNEVIKGTALTNWTDGLANDEFTITLNDHEDKDGYTFYWMVGDQMFRPGEATFKLNGVTRITEFWKAIVNTITGGGKYEESSSAASGAKGGSNIYRAVKGLTVLDKDRNVLHQGEDYYMVVMDIHGRYKVLFTQEQLDNLPDGENLFYIIDTSKVEHEYTLVIPPRTK